MQFEALKVFCDVARFRSFSQAAVANDLSQPAVSQVVLHLEKRLGVQLIDRSTRPFILTPQGQLYYDGCKGLIEQYLDLESTVRRSEAEITPLIQVVAIYSVGLSDMHQYVERFAEVAPGAEVRIEYVHPDIAYQRVVDSTADLGLVSYPKKSRDLQALAWREEEMVLACAPEHELARQRSVKPSQLNGIKWVGFDTNLVIHKKIDAFLRKHGAKVEVQMRFDNIESIKRAVELAAGVALLPRPTIEREIEAGTLKSIALQGAHLDRPLAIIHRRNRRLSASILNFISVLRQPEEPARHHAARAHRAS
ncbi:MAG: LysR family transcriptional regulator [Vicinamibacteria bacterium]|jgi:DNA-binding transcriptional LysR family regulator|nr:LysR family transcriptional regulator [Vicinamibacteria bacterium]